MSLIIDADGEYLSGGGAVLLASGATEFTHAIWVKRNTASAAYQSYAYVGRNPAEEYGSIWLAHNGNGPDCFVIPSGAQYRVNSASGADSTAWQLLVLTYKKDVEAKTYAGITGGSLVTHTLSSPTYAFNADIDEIRIGVGTPIIDGWYPRCKLAHHAFWNKCLSPSEAAELFNGGTAGAGKNPQAVANANLTFYAPLTSAATVSVSGITLSATGTLTYDGADNPNVEAYGGGSTSYTLTVDSGTYSLSGASLATPISVLMATGAGTYSVTGQDITFGGSSVYTLSLEAGAYNITSETPVIGISMGLDAGSYSIVGQDVTLSSTSGGGTVYSLSIEAGTYTTTGQDLSLIVAYLASLDAGTYDVTGKNVRLVSSTEPVIISSGNHTISVSIKIGI